MTRRTIIAAFAALAFFAGGGWLCERPTDRNETALAFDGADGAKFDGGYRWPQ